jgi:2-(1,2-epoxy-1,2-dihydrophenyl)acetyl-CoA isomerase
VTAGLGLSIAVACDIRIASEQASFMAAWVHRALISDGGATYYLPKLIGIPKALELIYTGERIDAEEAKRISLVNKVVPHDELMATVSGLAAKIAKAPPIAIGLSKKPYLQGSLTTLRSNISSSSMPIAFAVRQKISKKVLPPSWRKDRLCSRDDERR